jgi:NADP-dependent 3-hydroxy acid dehydrogenase YdfG
MGTEVSGAKGICSGESMGESRHLSVLDTTRERACAPNPLTGRIAVVTGASSGIGRAIALSLSRQGVELYVVGRDAVRLAETATAARKFTQVTDFQADLNANDALQPLLRQLEEEAGGLDILVHSAGVIHVDPLERACIENLDRQYATNVRAPYTLTQRLLPFLTAARGQIVFINSSVGLTVKQPDVGQYSATKHALKAIADSLREEINPKGVRVLTVYLGRTATPMQEFLHRREGTRYNPDVLLQPEDVASVVVQALMLPPTAEVTDISLRPMRKSY